MARLGSAIHVPSSALAQKKRGWPAQGRRDAMSHFVTATSDINHVFNAVAHTAIDGLEAAYRSVRSGGAATRMANRRQAVLAQNIANANTPGFKPHDLKPFTAA